MGGGEYTKNELLNLASSSDCVLVVHGPRSFTSSGAELDVALRFNRPGDRFVSTPGGDPTVEGVLKLLKAIEGVRIEAILAVGGGSVIDTAKLIKAFRHSFRSLANSLEMDRRIEPASIPLYVLPTLVGSGSEVTHFAVIYDEAMKYSVADMRLRPDGFAYCSGYVRRAPAQALAASALDGLCQAIESYWCVHSTNESRELARESIRLLIGCIKRAVIDRTSPEIEELQLGVNLGGRAIDLTKTTAAHAVSYALSSFYNVAHGHAVALLLPAFFEFNDGVNDSDCLDERGTEFVRQRMVELRDLMGVSTNAEAEAFFVSLMRAFGLPVSLEAVGIESKADLQTIVEHGFNPQRVNNNPRRLTPGQLETLLKSRINTMVSFSELSKVTP